MAKEEDRHTLELLRPQCLDRVDGDFAAGHRCPGLVEVLHDALVFRRLPRMERDGALGRAHLERRGDLLREEARRHFALQAVIAIQ
jgi:hypothetical protein